MSLVAIATLQSAQIDPACRPPLTDIADRIHVFARVYRRLSQSPGEATLDIQTFLAGLCDDLRAAHLGLRPVAIDVRAETLEVTIGTAVIVGLFTNEAITNALKYAFDEEGGGTITVAFERVGDGSTDLRLEVRDDGAGPSGGSAAKGTGLGSRLARSMASQLGGTHELVREDGFTVARLRFPRPCARVS